jgi:hypothetical protein
MIAAILLVLLASVMLLATGDNFPSAPLGKFFSTLLIVSLLTLLPEGPALRLGQAAAWATVANAFAQFGTVKQLVVEHKYGKQKFDGDRLDLSSNIPDAQLESLRNVASVYLLVTAAALLLLLFGWLSRRFLYRPLVSASSHEKFASPAVAESTGDQSPGLGPANLDTGGT